MSLTLCLALVGAFCQIYLELQRARLTVLLSRYHEKAAETAPPPPADGAFPIFFFLSQKGLL